MSIGLPIIIVAGYFLVMANFKHTETLSKAEEKSIEMYQDLVHEPKVEAATIASKEEKIAEEPEIDALLQVLKDREDIKSGENGDVVEELQQILEIDPDGFFGLTTEQAVKDFQHQNGQAVDGIVGPQTLETLLEKNTDAKETAEDEQING